MKNNGKKKETGNVTMKNEEIKAKGKRSKEKKR